MSATEPVPALQRGFVEAIRLGRLEDAIHAGERLVAAVPDDARAWFNLGWCRRQLRLFEGALTAYGKALDLGISHPEEARVNRAHILSDHLVRPDEAERELLAALEANPGFLPAHLSLGQLHEDLARTEQAERAYRAALALAPDCGRALARLSGLWHARGGIAQAVEMLERAICRLPEPSDDLAEVAMALGQHYEAEGRYEEAFAAYARANRSADALTPPELRYDPARADALAEALVTAPVPPAAPSGDRPGPVFILGMFRSGSTLLEALLGRHPSLHPGGELESLPGLAARLPGYPGRVAELSEEEVSRWRAQYWREVDAAVGPGPAGRTIDKRPDNFLHLGLIRRLFPDSPVIHTVRNDADIAMSVFGNLFGPAVPYANSLTDIVHWQGIHRKVMAHWRASYGPMLTDVIYEELVAEPERVLRRALAHCGVSWSDACLQGPLASGGVRTLSQWQVRRPLNAGSIGRAAAFGEFLHRG